MDDPALTLFSATTDAVMTFDGGSRGNPGPAAWGFTITGHDGTVLAAAGRTIGVATNNEAEYGGLIAGLERALELGIDNLSVHGDSKLVIEQMAGRWKVKSPGLQGLHRIARGHAARLASVTYGHVRRGENAAADRLVNAALDSDAGSVDGLDPASSDAPPTPSQ